MRRLRRGVWPARQSLLLAVLGPFGLALLMAGCATSSAEPTPAPQAMASADRDATEGDGLPPQIAPPAGIRRLPDDPREPFSRNYGSQPPAPPSPQTAHLSQAEEDALIARAITAHEMRRP